MLFGPARARDTPPRARWRRQGVGVVRGTPVCTNRYACVRPSAPQLNFGDAADVGPPPAVWVVRRLKVPLPLPASTETVLERSSTAATSKTPPPEKSPRATAHGPRPTP